MTRAPLGKRQRAARGVARLMRWSQVVEFIGPTGGTGHQVVGGVGTGQSA